jgi:hypothetical protein
MERVDMAVVQMARPGGREAFNVNRFQLGA